MKNKEYDQSCLGQTVDLLNVCFPEKKVSERSFLWKHYDKFFNGGSVGMAAFDGEKMCSFVCFTPVIIAAGKNNIQNFYSCAVQATHPKYRRQGIVSRLTQLIEKKIGSNAAYIGFSNDSGLMIDKFSKKINYKVLGQMATQYVLSFPYKTKLAIKKTNKISLENIEFSNYFGVIKSNEYLNWRYVRNPKNKYEYFKILKGEGIIGYIIYKNSRLKYEVIDLLLNTNDTKLYNEAIKAFAGFSLSRGKVFVSYSYLENKFWQGCFPASSIKNKISLYFTIKTTDSSLEDPNRWIIQGGDIQ